MGEQFKLKPISAEAIPEALSKAEQYRRLNEPSQAESICRDILRVQPDHQETLVVIILALTDQFTVDGRAPGLRIAREYVERLADDYEKAYYTGLIRERQARAMLQRGMSGAFAYEGFREAMDWYEKAGASRPAGNDDALLRWNSCVRTIRQRKLEPRGDEHEFLLE